VLPAIAKQQGLEGYIEVTGHVPPKPPEEERIEPVRFSLPTLNANLRSRRHLVHLDSTTQNTSPHAKITHPPTPNSGKTISPSHPKQTPHPNQADHLESLHSNLPNQNAARARHRSRGIGCRFRVNSRHHRCRRGEISGLRRRYRFALVIRILEIWRKGGDRRRKMRGVVDVLLCDRWCLWDVFRILLASLSPCRFACHERDIPPPHSVPIHLQHVTLPFPHAPSPISCHTTNNPRAKTQDRPPVPP
jgi:hypothetical protein